MKIHGAETIQAEVAKGGYFLKCIANDAKVRRIFREIIGSSEVAVLATFRVRYQGRTIIEKSTPS